jgi:hypothetical protein
MVQIKIFELLSEISRQVLITWSAGKFSSSISATINQIQAQPEPRALCAGKCEARIIL